MSLSIIWSKIFLVKLGQTRRMLNGHNKWNSKYLSRLFSFNWVQYEFQNLESDTATDMIKYLPFFIVEIPRAIMGLGNTQCSRRQYLDYWLNILRSLRNILPPWRNVCTINHIIVMFNNKFAVVYHANRGKELIRSSEWNKIAKAEALPTIHCHLSWWRTNSDKSLLSILKDYYLEIYELYPDVIWWKIRYLFSRF